MSSLVVGCCSRFSNIPKDKSQEMSGLANEQAMRLDHDVLSICEDSVHSENLVRFVRNEEQRRQIVFTFFAWFVNIFK